MKTLVLSLCLLGACSGFAQPPASHHLLPNTRVFIEPMDGYEAYLSAAIIKKQVPVTIVDDRAKADYVISGVSATEKAGWAKTLLTKSTASHASASVSIKDAKSGDVVYAYAVDKSNSARASQSTAEACAKHMKQDMETKEKW